MEERYSPEYRERRAETLEARYSYYRRCQMFRKNGEQCKAPAEKGSHICYAHAQHQAMALRRKLELTILLGEVARRMRAQGRADFEVEDIFMDFDAIEVTLAVMAQALIAGRISHKVAGQLAVGLQTAMKLLRMVQRKRTSTEACRHGKQQGAPQISADERGLERRNATENTKEWEGRSTFLLSEATFFQRPVNALGDHESEAGEEHSVHLIKNLTSIEIDVIVRNGFRRESAHAPPGLKRAA